MNYANYDIAATQRITNSGISAQTRQFHHSLTGGPEHRGQLEERYANNHGDRFASRNHLYKRNPHDQRNGNDRLQHRHPSNYYNQRNSDASYQHGHSSNHCINSWSSPRGCFNCGEHNHRQSNCRYDHRIRCNLCFRSGHKSRMCNLSSD